MRVALARLLLSPAGGGGGQKGDGATGGLLLLDEPTNHLDGAAIDWLANYLRELGQSGGSVKDANTTVLVSHDSNLLEVIALNILPSLDFAGSCCLCTRDCSYYRSQTIATMFES